MKIVIDTREQAPFLFSGERYRGTETAFGTLDTGDYSLAGLTDRVAVERKSLPDLVACLGRERERFERELVRAAALESFAVVVEDTWEALARGQYRSQLNPVAACQSECAFMARLKVSFLFAGSRPAAEYVCHSLLRQYLEGARKRYKSILRAHGEDTDCELPGQSWRSGEAVRRSGKHEGQGTD